jgi:hypothetical protein
MNVERDVFLQDLKHAVSKGNEFKECLTDFFEKYNENKAELQEFDTDEEIVETHKELVDILDFFG